MRSATRFSLGIAGVADPRPRFGVCWPLVFTIVCWGFNFVALKVLFREMPPDGVLLVRTVIMYVLLALFCVRAGESLAYPKGQALPILSIGAISMGLYMILFFEGMDRTGGTEGAIILATSPVMTALLAVLFRQDKFSWGAILGASLAFAGVVLVVTNGEEVGRSLLVGALLIFSSAFVWALATVLSRPVTIRMSPLRFLTLSMPGSFPIVVAYGITTVVRTDWPGLTLEWWLLMLHLSVLAGAIGFVGFFEGVRRIGAANTMLYQYFVPPIAGVCAYFYLGERITWLDLVGVLIVFAGVYASTRSRLKALTQVGA